MKIKSMALLLIVFSSFMMLLSPLGSVSTTSAQQERVVDQSVDAPNSQVDKLTDDSPCAIPPVEEANKQAVEEALARFRQENLQAALLPGSVTIYVYFHVISQGLGTSGDVPEHILDNQIAVLNASFSGMTGGTNTPFRFVKACAATRTYKPEWFQMTLGSSQEHQAKAELHRGGANALNFYTVSNSYGWGYFPWEYVNNPCLDGVVVPYTMLPGGSSAPFNEGDIGTHEVGHWLGLYHTFQGDSCSPNNNNDELDDTPAHLNFIGGCPTGRDSCPDLPGLDPIDNFMQNASDACKTRFTNEQSARMGNMYTAYRQSSMPQCGVTNYSGFLEGSDCSSIWGWAWDQNAPNTSISVDIYADGSLLARISANLFRSDLLSAGIGNGYHAFVYNVPSHLKNGQMRSIRVKFACTNTDIYWSPRSIVCRATLFPTQAPSDIALSAGGTTWEQATQFSSSIDGKITHIRFYKSPYETGSHIGRIWSDTGAQLAYVPFTGETPSGWQEAALQPPLPITAGVRYRVSYNVNSYGVKTFAGLNTPITNGPLTAHTSYYSTPAGTFPTTNSGSNLFADVRFNSPQ
ncbi:MAG TPA: DUF4082 domain-containing protein [Blastocatellia bacterium]|nr:DUF4082 domain-containing protein [Blastocatellia bacterium]